MATLTTSFLIGSSSFLQVMRTCIKAWMSFNFGLIPLTIESTALEHLKNLCLRNVLAPIDCTCISFFAGNKDNHKISNEFELQTRSNHGLQS